MREILLYFLMISDDVVETECINLVEATKDTQFDLTFLQLLLHLRSEVQYAEFLASVH